ncbi:MAG TPA: hypothetical protein PLZ67_07205 [Bacteroidales bacterium]|nr:hypothetical protein [Bacteroidales bacterium]HPF00202.1 hypothetical protein [Bacteroidales bacterium]
MKILRNSFVLVLIPLMVFSSGGFNIFKHMCHTTGEMMVSFQSPESCEHEYAEHSRTCNSSCCGHDEKETSCCENVHVFIRTVDNVSQSEERPEISNLSSLLNPAVKIVFVDPEMKITKDYLSGDYSSPPELSGKSTVIKHHALKIDCCFTV